MWGIYFFVRRFLFPKRWYGTNISIFVLFKWHTRISNPCSIVWLLHNTEYILDSNWLLVNIQSRTHILRPIQYTMYICTIPICFHQYAKQNKENCQLFRCQFRVIPAQSGFDGTSCIVLMPNDNYLQMEWIAKRFQHIDLSSYSKIGAREPYLHFRSTSIELKM